MTSDKNQQLLDAAKEKYDLNLTEEQAIGMANDEAVWQNMSDSDKAHYQIFTDRLFMPFGEFQMAVERIIGRPVWTHEFASNGVTQLKLEVLGAAPPRTMDEILELIPAEKRIVVVLDNKKE